MLDTNCTAGMLLLAGGTLMAPMLTSVASSTLMLATLVAMLIVCNVPRARSLPGCVSLAVSLCVCLVAIMSGELQGVKYVR